MSYPTQSGTLNRLEAETRKAGRKHEDACLEQLDGLWRQAKDYLRGAVMNEYQKDFGDGNWHTAAALGRGTLDRISGRASNELTIFYNHARTLIEKSLREAYRHEAMRQVWMLDMLTPPSFKPKLPTRALREAAVRPEDFKTAWDRALLEWLHAYHRGLLTNLRMEALHESGITDAADEVDATRIDGYEPGYKFSSALTGQILQAQRDAREDVADANEGLVAEEIFQTMEDARVCEDCDSQDGKRIEDVEMLPHVYGFGCRCFERIVPRGFAELLRNGTDEEKQAALDMDARGLIPDAMAIRDADGNLKAHIHVDFDQWMGQEGLSISGRAGAAQVGR